MEKLFSRLGRQMVRFRWIVIVLWLGLIILMGSAAARLPDALKGGGFEAQGSESTRVAELLRSEFPGQPAHTLLVVFKAEEHAVDRPEYRKRVEAVTRDLAAQSGVDRVLTTYNTGNRRLVSEDKQATFAVLALRTSDADEARGLVPEVRQTVQDAGLPGWMTARVTGGPAVAYDTSRAAVGDLPRAERIGLPIALAILVAAFGALVAAGLPLLIGLSAIAVTMGIASFLSQTMELSSFILNIVPMLGLGVGIDYCLLMVSRFREELAAGRGKEEAVVRTVASAGRAVAFSGATVAIGLSALLVPNLMVLRSLGLGGILVVAVAVTAAITLLPALLCVLGERVNAPHFLSRRLARLAGTGTTNFWRRWATTVMRRPIAFSLIALVVLVLLGLPALRINTLAPGATLLPEGVESREAFEVLTKHFSPGETSPINVIVDTKKSDGLWGGETVESLYAFARRVEKDPRVDRVESLVSLDPNMTLDNYRKLYNSGFDPRRAAQATPPILPFIGEEAGSSLVRVVPSVDPDSLAARDLVEAIRGDMIHAIDWPAKTEVSVGGTTAGSLDLEREVYGRLPLIIGYVVLATLVVLVVLLRSVVLPVQAVLMNGLSVLASFGLLVLVFQEGYGADWLGFDPPGAISSLIPVFIFCILFGLSMDYEIFLLSRMREAFDETGDSRQAVALGLERTGRIVTSAALIMVTIFASFALSSFVLLKETGIGFAAAVALDAFLIRVMLVPAVMRLLGRWNWWVPSFLQARARKAVD